MARISVDNMVSEISSDTHRNVGEILSEITGSLPADRVITGISLNGKHIPRSERNIIMETPIHEANEIMIKTSDKAIWAVNGIDISLSCLESIQRSLISVIELFRDNNLIEANHFFAHCIEGLERFTESMLITRCVLNLNYQNIHIEGTSLAQIEQELSSILRAILECQEKKDHEGIAERLEYELLTNLGTWQRGLRQIKNSISSNA